MKYLITGGCGFIGTNLVKHLFSEKAYFIRIIDNLSVGTKTALDQVCNFKTITSNDLNNPQFNHSRVELFEGDILDEKLAIDITKGIDVIVHLAANTGVGPSVENPRLDCITNVIGTLNYLEAAKINNTRFVFASSGAPIGECTPPIHEELAPHPASPYGASKLAGEGYCSAFFKSFGVKTVVLRFGNVYGTGSGHKSSVVAKFIRQAVKKETLNIYGNGNQTRDFIYITDLTRAIRLASETPELGGEIFQIATSKETTVNEILEQLIPILAAAGINNINVCNSKVRQGDVKRNFSDTSKAKRLLNWQSEVELVDGLKNTVNWFIPS